jgi:phenylalanyl-tRNA synthetase alpha chain
MYAGRPTSRGWAFGLGLERLAMVLFQIPDIRLFWSQDPRFSSQFQAGRIQTFQPYSKYPACYKDVSFWLPPTGFHENDLFSDVRSVAGDLVENVVMQSEFVHPKTKKTSRCYRILYRSMDRTMTNEEIDRLQASLRDLMSKNGLELR